MTKFGLLFGIIVFFSLSCRKEVLVVKETDTIVFGKINKILIIGNSITQHEPDLSLGWYGNWGMAASCEANDYVHRLISKFTLYNKNIDVSYGNIAHSFEIKFWTFDTLDFKSFKDFSPDLIIIRLGENVNDSLANKYGLGAYLSKLLDYLKNSNHQVVCCTSSFWPNIYIDKEIENVCLRSNYIYVPLFDLYHDKSNTAFDSFQDAAVGAHPSDNGMMNIANRIWEKLKMFFE